MCWPCGSDAESGRERRLHGAVKRPHACHVHGVKPREIDRPRSKERLVSLKGALGQVQHCRGMDPSCLLHEELMNKTSLWFGA